MLVYTGRLAIKAMTYDYPDLVPSLVNWCESYFRTNYLDQWINANGGWVSKRLRIQKNTAKGQENQSKFRKLARLFKPCCVDSCICSWI